MPNLVDREGTFRGRIVDYGLGETRNGAVRLSIKAELDECWSKDEDNPEDEGAWEDWRVYNVEAYGDLILVKTNGESNNTQVTALARHAGWDGRIESIADKTWKPWASQFSVEPNTYEGRTTYRIAFVNGWDDKPGGTMKSVSADDARKLAAKYGGKLMAAVSGVQATPPSLPPQPAPTGGPSIPF